MKVQERFWPSGLLRQTEGCGNEGVMEVGNGGDVPGVAGQGACEETASVIDEMVDDHFNDLLGKFGGRRRTRCGNLWRSATGTLLDHGQASVENSHRE